MSTLSSLSDVIVILIMVSLTKSGYNTRTRALFTVTKQFSNLSQVKFLCLSWALYSNILNSDSNLTIKV